MPKNILAIPSRVNLLLVLRKSYEYKGLILISLGFNCKEIGVLTHPMMRQYAFQALRARHDWLREHDPTNGDIGWVIAYIGWLGDPQALPWLVQQLEREEQEVLARQNADEGCYHEDEVGEYIYAIANLHIPEGIPILVERLLDRDGYEWRDTNKALRFYINHIPDERVVLAQLAVNSPENGYVDTEVIEAIGRTGLACAVPGLARLLVLRDDGCAEAINALAEIAKRNPHNTDLLREIVGHLVPMLKVKERVYMNYYYQPLETMPIDEFTAIVLKDIGTSEALAAVAAWEKGELRQF